MYVKELDLLDFRNYGKAHIELDPGTNVFYGQNAQGKTNILEALFLAGTTRSHRGAKDRDMIRIGEDEAHIRMILVRRGSEYRIDTHLRRYKTKGIAINGTPIRRAAELLGIASFVFFSPEDLGIVKNGPAGRRRFLDAVLSAEDQIYLNDLAAYRKILQQRNALLREAFANEKCLPELDVWDEQLVKTGGRIISRRTSFVEAFRDMAAARHSVLTDGKETLDLRYEPNVTEKSFAEQVFFGRDTDIRTGTTNEGPQRDDLAILSNGMDLRTFGSQGQQRTAALALKLAEIDEMEKARGERPVLLLDDVLSELDDSRRRALLAGIRSTQTLITCTGLDEFVREEFQIDRAFHVSGGQVENVQRPE